MGSPRFSESNPVIRINQAHGSGRICSFQTLLFGVAYNATSEQREIAREAMLTITGQEDGKLIVVADGEMSEFDIPVYIILLG